jgi:hypothetical protein
MSLLSRRRRRVERRRGSAAVCGDLRLQRHILRCLVRDNSLPNLFSMTLMIIDLGSMGNQMVAAADIRRSLC